MHLEGWINSVHFREEDTQCVIRVMNTQCVLEGWIHVVHLEGWIHSVHLDTVHNINPPALYIHTVYPPTLCIHHSIYRAHSITQYGSNKTGTISVVTLSPTVCYANYTFSLAGYKSCY